MREILFRGKRIDNGEWVYGHIYTQVDLPDTIEEEWYWYIKPIGSESWVSYRVDPYTVGQYTGLKDKNGERIFEGDVCRFREWSKGEMCWVGKVHWEHQQFMISGGPNKECETMFELCMSRFIPENIEVIGNIQDNPELLKEEAQS